MVNVYFNSNKYLIALCTMLILLYLVLCFNLTLRQQKGETETCVDKSCRKIDCSLCMNSYIHEPLTYIHADLEGTLLAWNFLNNL